MKKALCIVISAVMIALFVSSCSPGSSSSNGDYDYKLTENGDIEITKYKGNDKSIDIPSKLDGKNIVSIGEEAFLDNHAEKITLPEGLKVIEDKAFYDCSFKTIDLPSTLERIEDEAFFDCYALEEISIPHSVVYIGDNAFTNTSLQKQLKVDPNPELELGKECFAYTSLETVTVFPVKSSGGRTFASNIITEVKIADNVTKIYDEDFYNCENLKSVYIPPNVTTIGKKAFGYYIKDIFKNGEEDSEEVITEGFRILGAENSEAQTYALNNNIAFENKTK